MYGYIYETTNVVNKRKYIGQHHGDFSNKYIGSGSYLHRDIEKYGKDNFNVILLEECFSQKDLDFKERLWIENLRKTYPIELIYNISDGGQTRFYLW